MTRFGWIVSIGVLVALVSVALLLWAFGRQSEPATETAIEAPALDPNALSIYSSGEHGFSFMYPDGATLSDGNGALWRAHGIATGTLVASITAGASEARVGVSGNERAIEVCEEAAPSETAGLDYVTEHATWRTFAFEELGTEAERRVTSYRRLVGERCVAVELSRPSVDDAAIPDLDMIIRTFTFATP